MVTPAGLDEDSSRDVVAMPDTILAKVEFRFQDAEGTLLNDGFHTTSTTPRIGLFPWTAPTYT